MITSGGSPYSAVSRASSASAAAQIGQNSYEEQIAENTLATATSTLSLVGAAIRFAQSFNVVNGLGLAASAANYWNQTNRPTPEREEPL